jgi:hypothetical protein
MKVALFAPAVVAGIWGATLSSALGGILGGPRILQAMSKDKVTPRIFAKGRGKNNEPVLALLLVFVIAEAGILIGELDVIARVVSMFYLAAYGFINITFFLESWANPDFQPSFKIKRWIGLIGFVACFGVMFKLDMVAMILALAVIGGLYMMLQRKEVKLQSNDIWKNVWENVVNKGLKRIDNNNVKNANWNPNIILFSGQSEHQKYLLELCKAVAGRTGIITNFKLIVDKENTIPFKKVDQKLDDPIYKELGIFARQIKVTNLYSGIANIATTFGFSGIEPNTIMMGWPKGLEQSTEYAQMTETLLHLDYNLLYLDFDYKTKFGNYKTVDLWWRETDSKNAEMMLNIARFIIASPYWHQASIRVMFVNNNAVSNLLIRAKILKLVDDLRVNVEIVIIDNVVEQIPFYDLIKTHSKQIDLTVIGVPNYKIEKQAEYVLKTSELFETIGSALMVKAANNFNELDLDFTKYK